MKIQREVTTTATSEVNLTVDAIKGQFPSPAKVGYGEYSVAGAFCQFTDPAGEWSGFPYSATLLKVGLAAAGVPAGDLSSGDTKLVTALAKDVVRRNSDGEFNNAWRALRRFIRVLDLLKRAHA